MWNSPTTNYRSWGYGYGTTVTYDYGNLYVAPPPVPDELRDVEKQLARLGRQVEAFEREAKAHLAVVLAWLRTIQGEIIELWREGPPRPVARTLRAPRRGRAVALANVWRLARAPP